MVIWTVAKKDLRLLVRDVRAVLILLAMPLFFILVLGVSVGEGFGQKPDDRLRVTIVDLDQGDPESQKYFGKRWSEVVRDDLASAADIRIEMVESEAKAKELVRNSQRAAILVFRPEFSQRVTRSSFLDTKDGINPFYRDGVKLEVLDAEVLHDPTQGTASAIIDQVAQVSLMRVVMPWMIGKAFEKIGEPEFIDLLGAEAARSKSDSVLLRQLNPNATFAIKAPEKKKLANGVQMALQALFSKYNLTGKTWAALTKAEGGAKTTAAKTTEYKEEGAGMLKLGAQRYQVLVPSYLVMFSFFLVLTVGWLFVAERRQGTLKRLRAAPTTRAEIVLGKLLPCLLLSLAQGFFLLLMGRLLFGMSWGPQPLWLIPVVVTTSFAAMGLALLVASLARTETQVAIYGTLLVLVLAGLSGCLMGDRSLMPELMQQLSRVTPHAWALDAYRQLLANPEGPNVEMVATACGVLTAFGAGFVALAWWVLRLD
jgi:ABC-type multidrug transport system permease subunit